MEEKEQLEKWQMKSYIFVKESNYTKNFPLAFKVNKNKMGLHLWDSLWSL